MMKYYPTLSSRTTFHIIFLRRNAPFNSTSNYIHTHTTITRTSNDAGSSYTVLRIILGVRSVTAWQWVMQLLPGCEC